MTFFPFMDSANAGDVHSRWTTDNIRPAVGNNISASGRDVYIFQTNTSPGLQLFPPAAMTDVLATFKIFFLTKIDADGTSTARLYSVLNGVTPLLTLGFAGSGAVVARLGAGNGTILAQSSAGVISPDVWHQIECRTSIDNAAGRFEVWVDTVKVIDFTGDTQVGADTDFDLIRFSTPANQTVYMSDFIIDDVVLPKGVVAVWDLFPSADGASSALTPLSGVDNFAMVDENPPDDDTSYVSGNTEGQKDTYVLTDLPSGSWDVLAVQVSRKSKKSDSGTRFIRPVVRTGGVDFVGTSEAEAESYRTRRESWRQNPDTTLDWTQADVDALEVGSEIRDS